MILALYVSVLVLGVVYIGECRDLSPSPGGLVAEESERMAFCIDLFSCISMYTDPYFWKSNREKVDTEFRFWAPNNTQAEVMNNFNFHVHITKDSGYNPNIKTFFIIHGYLGGNAPWAVTMKDELMKKEPCNVFIVDWSGGHGPLYWTAMENIWIVRWEVGRFIERVVELTGMKPDNVHIIGHSLGAHTAGLAGKYVKNKLGRLVGRITGLDPAGPYFHEVVTGKRLDKDDATFVDVIHTNHAGWGIQKPIGHFDFYPNGGANQLNCPIIERAGLSIGQEIMEYVNPTFKIIETITGDNKNMDDAINDLSCSHGRAYDYFIESLNSKGCQFWADECASWEDYTANKCPPGTTMRVPMGYDAKKFRRDIDSSTQKTFYLRTKATSPYCIP